MSRLVAVSNRLPGLRSAPALGGPEAPAGGLAAALLSALRGLPESLWFGWSGRIAEPGDSDFTARRTARGVHFVGTALTRTELHEYYYGFCNDTLWPLFHCFQGSIHIQPAHEARYRAVQARFAAALAEHLAPDDVVWVHDYHLLLLGRELRKLGWRGRLAFFLHIPFPPLELWDLLPDPRDFTAAMLEYDVVGLHIQRFADNYIQAATRRGGAAWDGIALRHAGRTQHVGVYPVGIDPDEFAPGGDDLERSRRRATLGRVVGDRRILVGVDRLDYTKGIVERILGVESFLRTHPEWRNRVVFIQVAAPSRTRLPAYRREKLRVEAQVSRVNGELGEHDWMPIRYLCRSYSHDFLARVYREADAALVTPLRDGMNLVAKEFIAAQDAADPGSLILSRSAGAAEELDAAILVNPFVPSDIARGIREALESNVDERRRRHALLHGRVLAATADDWSRRFLADLRAMSRRAPLEATTP